MEFKEKLKSLRKENGLSQQALADAIFVSRSAVAKWENGLGFPSEESLLALQEYFGVPEAYFATPEPEQVIAQKNRHIKRLNLRFAGVLLAVALAAAVVIPQSDQGMQWTARLLRPVLEKHAHDCLEIPDSSGENFLGYRVTVCQDAGAVFYVSNSWGYRGIFYSEDGEPVGFQGTEAVFYRCGKGSYYWAEENGDNWMHAEHIAGNWYWYEMHF